MPYFYSALALITLYDWYKFIKTHSIAFDENNILIKTYFTDREITVPIKDIISVKKASSIIKDNLVNKKTYIIDNEIKGDRYKMKYTFNGKTHSIYFFRSIYTGQLDNVALLLGIKK